MLESNNEIPEMPSGFGEAKMLLTSDARILSVTLNRKIRLSGCVPGEGREPFS